jgi:hypothetical protein
VKLQCAGARARLREGEAPDYSGNLPAAQENQAIFQTLLAK